MLSLPRRHQHHRRRPVNRSRPLGRQRGDQLSNGGCARGQKSPDAEQLPKPILEVRHGGAGLALLEGGFDPGHGFFPIVTLGLGRCLSGRYT
jgi:hypothetical protein